MGNTASSNDSDRRLFETLGAGVASKIVAIKNNDPEAKTLSICNLSWNASCSTRLGFILGQNTTVQQLTICGCNLDVVGLCEGLQHNRHIQSIYFNGIDLSDPEKMSSLAPFLSHNPSLERIDLESCRIDQASLNILSNSLSGRSEDTIEELDLSSNGFSDIDLDGLVESLSRSRSLKRLSLLDTGIGRNGSTSLARLLANQESNLEVLDLYHNSIDDDSAIILADSLSKNTKLTELCLTGNDGIATVGWTALLNLVCNSSRISDVKESNHTLCDLSYLGIVIDKKVAKKLGFDDVNLLRASLEMNCNHDKMLVVRRKILWSHAREKINLGAEPSIPTAAIPRIMAWLGNDADETITDLVDYYLNPCTIRLGSLYRIVRSRPNICNAKKDDLEHRPRVLERRQSDSQPQADETNDPRGEISDIREEIDALRKENEKLRQENEDVTRSVLLCCLGFCVWSFLAY